MVLLLALLACGSGGEGAPAGVSAPAAPESEAPAAPRPEPKQTGSTLAAVGAEGSVPVELRFYELSALHQGFFADPEPVGALGVALGACLTDTAQVIVRYDSEERVGRIVLKVPPEALGCLPTTAADAVDLAPLRPVTEALARYRDSVAGRFDYRLAGFRVGVDFTRGARQCTLWLGGQHPPDGTRFSPCVELAGVRQCAVGSAEEGVTSLRFDDPAHLRYVQACVAR